MTLESGDLPLEEVLQFQPHSFQEGLNPFSSPTRPVGSGISWLATNGTGLVARVTRTTKISIQQEQHPSDSNHKQVELQTIITTAGIVRLAFHQSLLVVAQNDGSMECYDILPNKHSLRWRLSNAHSFVSSEVDKPVSSDRDWGAGAAGPLASLEFNAFHQLLLVDAGTQQVLIYNAAESAPSALVVVADSGATCATWISKDTVAVGNCLGNIEVYIVANQTSELLSSLTTPADDGFCCTYLACYNASTIVAGFCNVLVGESDDDEDEDDTAEHIVNMFLASLDDNTLTSEWSELGDVVPFFSVPHSGRHVFYTQCIDSILVVGTNVASEIALLYMPDASLLELTEGAGATTPTTENDDFTFCVGLATVGNLLYISATDGSLTCLELRHLANSDYFSPPALLPLLPVPIEQSTAAQMPATASPSFGSLSKTPASGETVDACRSPGFGESRTPGLETAKTFGRVQTGSVAMGQATMFGAATPDVGQTSVFGATTMSFGQTTFGTTPAFGAFGAAPVSDPFTFGLTSNATCPKAQVESSTPAPILSVGEGTTFGSGTSAPSVGIPFGAGFNRPTFGALASETKDSPGFLKRSDSTPGTISNPFGAFGVAKGNAAFTGMTAKPLFGSPVVPQTMVPNSPFGAFGGKTSSTSTTGMTATPLFGSPPPQDVSLTLPTEMAKAEDPDYESILKNFYEKDHPEKLKDIPKLLKKFKGKESEMFAKIAKTYGVPNPLDVVTARVLSKPEESKPSTTRPVDAVDGKGSLSSTKGIATMPLFGSPPVQDVSPTLPTETAKPKDPDYALILKNFYEKDHPEKLKDIPKLLKKFEGKESEMFAKIAKTYGVPNPLEVVTSQEVSEPEESEQSTPRVTQEETDVVTGAEAAAEVFDAIDKEKTGELPIERFEDLLDELGEGFHGGEFDLQLKMVDPEGTKCIQREMFIKWYCGLIAEDEDDDDAVEELDQDELEEREEERQRVRSVFRVFSSDDGVSIPMDLFPKFMKKIGTTYAEEVHGKAARSIEGPSGSIAWNAFDAWYIPWLFEGDDESDEEEEVVREGGNASGTSTVAGGWGDIFSKPKGWKCGVCMIQNDEDKKKCVSCETVRAGLEAEVALESSASVTLPGTSSFSFGAPSAAVSALPGPSGFSFGVTALKPQVSSTFSFCTPVPGSIAPAPVVAPVSSVWSFGVKTEDTMSSRSAFGFGVVDVDKPSPQRSLAFGAASTDKKSTMLSSAAPAAVTGYPPMSSKAPSKPFGSTTLDVSKGGSSTTSGKAATAMSSPAPRAPVSGYPPMSSKAPSNPFGSSAVNASKGDASTGPDYGALLMRVYQEHEPTKIGDIPVLLKKYKGKEAAMFEKVAKKYGIANPLGASLLSPKLLSPNPSSIVTNSLGGSSSNDIPLKPTKPTAPWSSATDKSPFGTFGLSNSAPNAVATSMAKPLFGLPAGKTISGPTNLEVSTPRVTQEEIDDVLGAEAAAEVFDAIDKEKTGELPIERFEDLLDELGEGFHGGEFDLQLKMVDPEGTKCIQREMFIKWYCGLIAEDEDDDDAVEELDQDELEEREEERQRVRSVFRVFSSDDGVSIPMDLFPKFMKKIGTTYAEEVHGKAARSIEGPSGSIAWNAFDAWYIPWLFEGDDESDEEEEVVREGGNASGTSTVAGGWGDIFSKPKGWKCGVCMIQNDEDKKKCVSCETVRAGLEAEVALESSASVTLPGTSSFSFGAPSAAVSALPGPSGFSFGVTALKPQVSSTFSFCTPVPGSIAPAPVVAPVSSVWSFGVKTEDTMSSRSAFGFGVVDVDKPSPQRSLAFGAASTDKKSTMLSSAAPAAVTGYPPMSSKAPSKPFGSTTLDVSKGGSSTTSGKAATAMSSPAPRAPVSGYPPMSSKAPSNPFGSSAVNASKGDASTGPDYGALLMRVYQEHEPTKIGDIPVLLKKYKGKEAAMFEKVAKKYGIANPLGGTLPSPNLFTAPSGYPPLSGKAPTNPFTSNKSGGIQPSAPVAASSSGLSAVSSSMPLHSFGKSTASESTTKLIMPSTSSGYSPLSLAAPTNPFGKSTISPPGVSSGPSRFAAAVATSAGVGSNPSTAQSPPSTSQLNADRPIDSFSDSSTRKSRYERQILPQSDDVLRRPVSAFEVQFVEAMQTFQEVIQSLRELSASSVDALEKDVRVVVANREKMWNYMSDFKSEATLHKQRGAFLLSRIPDLERQVGEAKRLIGVYRRTLSGRNGTASTQALDAESEKMRRRLAAEAIMIPRLFDILEGEVRLVKTIQRDRDRTIRMAPTGKVALLETVKNVTDLSSVVNGASSRCYNKVIDMSDKVPKGWDGNAWKSPEPKVRQGRRGIILRPNVGKNLNARPQVSEVVLERRASNFHRWQKIERCFQVTGVDVPIQSKIDLAAPLLTFKRERISTNNSLSARKGQNSMLLSPPHMEKRNGGSSSGASIVPDLFSMPASSFSTRPDWDAGFTTDQVKVRNLSFNLPEHLNEVKSSDAARESLAQYGTTPEKLARVMESKARTAAASDTMPDKLPPDHPPTFKKDVPSSFAGLPTMATKASSNFASTLSPVISSGYPPMPSKAPTLFGPGNEQKEPPSKSQRKPQKIDSSSPFGGMQSLGAALFPIAAPLPGDSVFASTQTAGPSKAAAASKPDYPALLTQFYETHNPEKVKDVSKHLDRYKGREDEMFGKLAARYKTTNPLDDVRSTPAAAPTTSFGAAAGLKNQFGAPKTMGTNFMAKESPFGSALSTPAPSPFRSTTQGNPHFGSGSPLAGPTTQGHPHFGGGSPLIDPTTQRNPPFGGGSPLAGPTTQGNLPFGGGSPLVGPTGFGSASSSFGSSTLSQVAPAPAFGSMPANNSFVLQSQVPVTSPFATGVSTPFGTVSAPNSTPFGGKSNRELLVAFYQQHNPSKLSDVDMVLQKYKGQEEKLFRNLAHKYKLDPSVFGLSQTSNPTATSGGLVGGFGQASQLGGGDAFGGGTPSPAPFFGSASAHSTNSAFGGGGFGGSTPTPAATGFGASPSGGFGSTAPVPGFGSHSTFGSPATVGGFGSLAKQSGGGFGTPAAGGFGGASPFGAPSSGGFGTVGTPFGGSPFGAPRR